MIKLTFLALVLGGGLIALPAAAGGGDAGTLAKAKAAVTKRDYGTAFNLLKPLAEAGDAAAQVQFGELYYNGTGVPRDIAAAMDWYQKAADQGFAEGEDLIGDSFLWGDGKTQDFVAALAWYRKAADQDYVDAEQALALIFKNGLGVGADQSAAKAWSDKAQVTLTRQAEAGDPKAETALGSNLVIHWTQPQDGANAKAWFERAAAQDYAPAEEALAQLYSEEPALARQWCRKAANDGNVEAQADMAGMYYRGDGVPKDGATYLKWLRLAAEGGGAYQQYELSHVYRDGDGAPKNESEAAKWLREAAEGGVDDAQMELAGRYASGEGVARDPAMSVKWYLRAALNSDPNAQYQLGLAYAKGEGVSADPVEAYKRFAIAIALANEIPDYSDVVAKGKKARDDLGVGMSQAQIALGEAEAKAFRSRWFAPPVFVPRVRVPQTVSAADATK